MKFCFIVAGMDKRIPFLNKCIDAYRNSKYSDCDIFLYFQGDKIGDVKGKEIFTDIVIDPKPRGVFTPRYELMKRFCGEYDYTILIDDDLYITKETCFEKTCKFMEAYKHVGCSATMNRRQFIKNKIEIVPFGDEINVQGGLVIRREAVLEIVEYFKDKEADYTFDCFWTFLWIKGWDLGRDFRSFANHMTVAKVDGEYTGFNEALAKMDYIPFLSEYLYDPPVVLRHKRYERDIPGFREMKPSGFEERKRCRKLKGWD